MTRSLAQRVAHGRESSGKKREKRRASERNLYPPPRRDPMGKLPGSVLRHPSGGLGLRRLRGGPWPSLPEISHSPTDAERALAGITARRSLFSPLACFLSPGDATHYSHSCSPPLPWSVPPLFSSTRPPSQQYTHSPF